MESARMKLHAGLRAGRPASRPDGEGTRGPGLEAAGDLTPAEIDVLALVAMGKTNHEIALARGSAEGTVRNQLSAVYRRLGVRHRSEAVVVALRSSVATAGLEARVDADAFDIAAILPSLVHCRVDAGRVLYRRGQRAAAMYFLLRGQVVIGGKGVPVPVRSFFGHAGVFAGGGIHAECAHCVSDVDLFELPTGIARRLCVTDPAFGFHMVRLLADQVNGHEDVLH